LKIVLTNDDGIDAPGLDSLAAIFAPHAEVVVVAPASAHSGVGHRVTCHLPIAVEQRGANRYGVMGTPADCARLALKLFAADADWLVAGINAGANLGSDVYQSGTVAAAREAAILGVRAIAISQYIARDSRIDWQVTRRHAARALQWLQATDLPRRRYWNVNLPNPLAEDSRPNLVRCGLDQNPHAFRFQRRGDDYQYVGSIHDRPRDPGKDVAVCFGGDVSITQLEV